MNTITHKQGAAGKAANLRRRALPLLIASCFAGNLQANPVGPQVINGQASFVTQGNTLSITNTPGAIINWQNFSINPGELTRFLQQNPNSAVLNRVTGGDPSAILGALQSNGKVFLINPNGILFGQGAQVDVNGLVASTLHMSNEDFLLGRMNFQAGSTAGKVENQGAITTPTGGQVLLIAPNVENSGIITSPKGEVLLAAGHTVQLVDSGNPDLHVVLSAPDDQALNLGQIIAQGGKTGIYGALVNQRGIINANSAVMGENGKIVFKASRDTLLEDGSRTTATGAGSGGEIHVLGERVALTGDAQIDASGQQGGGTVLVGGDMQGGNPGIRNASQTHVGENAQIKADATANGNGGRVIVWSDDTTRALGSISVRGGEQGGDGGFVETSGRRYLEATRAPDISAPRGRGGEWLLDPEDITIWSGINSANMPITTPFAPTAPGSATLSDATLRGALVAGGTVTVDTTGGGTGTGNILVDSSANLTGINAGSSAILNLKAHGDITIGSSITSTGSPLAMNFVADQDNSGVGSIAINSAITSNNGAISLTGRDISIGAAVAAGTNDVNLSASGTNGTTLAAAVSGANVNIKSDKLSVTGALTAAQAATITRFNNNVEVQVGGAGSDGANVLNVNSAEIGNITASTYRFGDTMSTGGLRVAGAVTMPAGKKLSLLTSNVGGSQIVQNAGATITADYLRVEGGSGVTLNDAAGNSVGNIAGKTISGDFQFKNAGALNLATIDGQTGIDAGVTKVKLDTTGNLTQSAGAIIAANGLAVDSTANVTLTQANKVSAFAAHVNWSPASALDFWNDQALLIDSVAGITGITGVVGANPSSINVKTTTGNLTIGQAISVNSLISGAATTILTAADRLDVNAGITSTFNTAGDGAVKLVAGIGGITSNAAGIVKANTLEIGSNGSAGLGDAHVVNTVAASVSGDLTLGSAAALSIGTAGATNGITASGTVTLKAPAAVTQTKPITAAGLELLDTSAAAYTLTGANSVGTLAANVAGGLSFTNSGALNIGSAGTTNGVKSTGGGNIALNSTGSSITVNDTIAADEISTGGNITLQSAGNFSTAAGSSITGGKVDISTLSGGSLAVGGSITSTLASQSNATSTLRLATATAHTVTVGGSLTAASGLIDISSTGGNIQLNGPVSQQDTAGAISVDTGNNAGSSGAIISGGGSAVLTADDIRLQNTSGFGAVGTYGSPINTGSIGVGPTKLSIGNAASKLGQAYVFHNSGGLDLFQVETLPTANVGFTAFGGTLKVLGTTSINGSNVTLNAQGLDLQAGAGLIGTAGGTVELAGGYSSGTNKTVLLGAEDGTNVGITDAELDRIGVGSTGTLRVMSDAPSSIVIGGNIDLTGNAGTLTLKAGNNGISLSDTFGITVPKLAATASGGNIDLSPATTTNSIGSFAANLIGAGNLLFKDNAAFSVDTVDGVVGIGGTGMTSLRSTGGITQTQTIGATSLQVSGSTVNLPLSNPVGVIAGGASAGSFSYKSSNGIHVTTVDGVAGLQNTGTGGDITLVSQTANISQDAPISTGVGFGLSLTGSSDIILQHPGNNVSRLAASSGTGAINVFNMGPLDIDAVGGVTGLTTVGGPISVSAGGLLAIKKNVNAGSQDAAFEAPDVQIGASGAPGISMNAGFIKLRANRVGTPGTITTQGTSGSTLTSSSGLVLEADLMGFSSAAPTFNATTEIAYRTFSDDRPITVGTACHGGGSSCLVIGGATNNAPDLVIGNETVADINTAGDIWVDTALAHAGGRVALLTGGAIGQTAAMTANGLGFIAGTVTNAAGVTLNAANSIANVAGITNGGAVSLTNTPALSVVQMSGGDPMYSNVTTVNGIMTNGGNITIQNAGNVTLAAPLVAGAGALNLTSSAGSLSGTGGGIASGASLVASAATGINLLTDVPLLSADNSGTASDIIIDNYQPATYQNVRQTTAGSTGNITISNSGAMTVASGGAISAEKGAISVTAYHALTVDGTVSTTGATAGEGNITLEAYPSNTANGTDNLVVNGSVTSNAGNILLKAGDTITVNGSVASTAGTITQTPNLNGSAATPPPTTSGPTLDQCTADPTISGCSTVLPSVDTCTTSPTTAGCTAVLPSIDTCTASPTTAGCTAVLPSLDTCTASPTTAGCTAVLPSLATCTTSPTTAGCTAVLPSLDTCTVNPSTTGCTAVLPSLATCTTSPTTAGCTAVLPSLATCTTSPTTAGCTAVLPSLATCTTSPTTAGCTAVLPTMTQCSATPTLAGCTAVLPTLATCTTSPTTAGCTAVLPPLDSCIANPTLAGCTAVLPTVTQCTTSPTLSGCSVVLPTLSTCTASPTTAGCTAVLPTITTCTTSPATAGCSVVLPTLSTCTTSPTTAGCTAVLPSIDQCTANLSLAGCTAVLPSITQCTATPSLPGCSVVMPAASQCTTNPSLPECTTVLPPTSPATTETVSDTITSTVNTVVTTTTSTQTTTVLVSATTVKPASSAGTGSTTSAGGGASSTSTTSTASTSTSSSSSDGTTSEEKKDERKDTAGPKDDGVKKNEPAKKLYCN